MTEIRWYRSWPSQYQGHCACCDLATDSDERFDTHARVEDNLPRIYIDQYNYMTAVDGLPKDRPGWCLLEWDVALSSSERTRFAITAAQYPDSILVAPYDLYPFDGNPECAHRYITTGDPIVHGLPLCETFGLGCIYIPHSILDRFIAEGLTDLGLTDASFSRWAFEHYGPTWVDWSFHPQHLSGD